jgi:UDP-N-acetylglucosamine 1-carboxyvinyltransferase
MDKLLIRGGRPLNRAVTMDSAMSAALLELCEAPIQGAEAGHLDAVVEKLRETEAQSSAGDGCGKVQARGRRHAVGFRTSGCPAVPTDMLARLMVVNRLAQGVARTSETSFDHRFLQVSEPQRLTAQIAVHGHAAFVEGKTPLSGATVMATDLRALGAYIERVN